MAADAGHGNQYTVGFNAQKTSSTNSFSSYNPALSANLAFNFNQPLLRDRGRYVNRLPLMQAQSNYQVSEYNLRSQLLKLFNNAEAAYWNVILGAGDAERRREGPRHRGGIPAVHAEAARPGSAFAAGYLQPATDSGGGESGSFAGAVQPGAGRRCAAAQLGADLDPDVRKLPLVLTESVDLGPSEALTVDREQAVERALVTNPSIKSVDQKLDVDNLSIQSAKNGLLPRLTFNAQYSANGQGGIYYPGTSLGGGSTASLLPVQGGIADALSQMFGFGFPTYVAGLTLQLPIRSRAASATLANALVAKKQDALTLRSQQQQIRLSVLNAITALEGAKESLKLANTQREFAKLNQDAMEEKYRLGAEINQNVINAQQNLAAAELQVVNSQISVRRSLLNLLTQTGELLDVRGVVIK